MNDAHHFNLKSEGQEYCFDIVAAKSASSDTIIVGGRHYTVVPENPLDLSAIQLFLQQARINNTTSISMLEQNQLPSFYPISQQTWSVL